MYSGYPGFAAAKSETELRDISNLLEIFHAVATMGEDNSSLKADITGRLSTIEINMLIEHFEEKGMHAYLGREQNEQGRLLSKTLYVEFEKMAREFTPPKP